MGYAIPISAAKPIIGDLMLKETRFKVEDGQVGYLGVSLQTITDEFAYMYDFPKGIFIRNVMEGSPAKQAGILNGDIITKFDGDRITSYEDLQEVLQYYGPGSTVTVTVMRVINGEYEEIQCEVTLGSKPEE